MSTRAMVVAQLKKGSKLHKKLLERQKMLNLNDHLKANNLHSFECTLVGMKLNTSKVALSLSISTKLFYYSRVISKK